MKLRYFESVIFCPSWFRTLSSPSLFSVFGHFARYLLTIFANIFVRSDSFLYSAQNIPKPTQFLLQSAVICVIPFCFVTCISNGLLEYSVINF